MADFLESLELLRQGEQQLQSVVSFYRKQNFDTRFDELKKISITDNFWQQKDFIEKSRQLSDIQEIRDNLKNLQSDFVHIKELVEMVQDDPGSKEAIELVGEIERFARAASKFKMELLLSGEYDKNNCFLSINPGAGGTESQDWADILLRMYQRFCERNSWNVEIIDHQKGAEAGIKTVTLFIKGKNSYGFLKTEAGIHRLVRISPFDSNKRRHTSFAAVSVSPEVEESAVEIRPDDLRIDTYRSGGAGGQHVNTTDSAVRITHIPTGVVSQCQNERSQHKNKDRAMKMLYSKIVAKLEREKREAASLQDKQKIEWGSQIRSYVLHPYRMVKDHRTNLEHPQPEKVLDGELDGFVESVLAQG